MVPGFPHSLKASCISAATFSQFPGSGSSWYQPGYCHYKWLPYNLLHPCRFIFSYHFLFVFFLSVPHGTNKFSTVMTPIPFSVIFFLVSIFKVQCYHYWITGFIFDITFVLIIMEQFYKIPTHTLVLYMHNNYIFLNMSSAILPLFWLYLLPNFLVSAQLWVDLHHYKYYISEFPLYYHNLQAYY